MTFGRALIFAISRSKRASSESIGIRFMPCADKILTKTLLQFDSAAIACD
jgi:hypothetical protein